MNRIEHAESNRPAGYGFGTFQGVFTPSILTIIGVVMYLRFGWMLGNVGLTGSLALVTIGSTITLLTGLSISALATNMRMKGGGAYFMLSRSLGLESGAALGIPLALSQAIGVSFYVAGFAEALTHSSLPVVSDWDIRTVGLVTLGALALLSTLSADLALKSQYFIMGAIALSLVSFFAGSPPVRPDTLPAVPKPLGFWPVFAVFFPAVTGILSGLGMSGDLKTPQRSIPLGTIAAVLTGFVIYSAVPIVLNVMVDDAPWLRADTMILQKCARWPMLVLLGVWAATLSSAVGSFLCAPRVLQALSRDRLLPGIFGRGFGKTDDPRISSVACFVIAAAGILLGDINVLAPILTLFNLSTYALLNFAAASEEILANPSWRPTFRLKPVFPVLGFVGCVGAMFMISPGWAFIAIGCELAIYWAVTRRQLRVQFGDVRTGLLAALVRFAFRRLAADRHAARNWRPNLLVFSRLPVQNMRLLMLAKGITDGRSFVTLASLLPPTGAALDMKALTDSVRRTGANLGLELLPHLRQAENPWAGIVETLRCYGFGPLTPNTVIFGTPKTERVTPFAGVIQTAVREGRNVLISSMSAPPSETGYLDIWWRGSGNNGAFMLALAVLLHRVDSGRHPLRVNMLIHNRTRSDAETRLSFYLSHARIDAETRILNTEGHPFADVIANNSSNSSLTLIGMRPPREGEPPQRYGTYLEHLFSNIASVPAPVFVLSSANNDLSSIFA